MNELKKGFFDPKTAFFSLPIIKWTLGIGIILIIGVCLWITLFSSREFDPRAEGFNELLEMMKFPIFLLGFFAALLALFATNHRSEQNKAAMHLAESQNRFSNFYKHIEEYENYLQNQFKRYPEDTRPIINIQKLHRCLYPNAKSDGIQFSKNIERIIFENIIDFTDNLIKTGFTEKESIQKLIVKADECQKNIQSLLTNSIKFRQEDGTVNFISENGPIKIPSARVRLYFVSILAKFEFINAILHFEETFNSDHLDLILIEIKQVINGIPNISIGGSGVVDWHENHEAPLSEELEQLEKNQKNLQEMFNVLLQKIQSS